MTQDEKAVKYDQIVRESDVLNRELSKLKSANSGFNTKSVEYDDEVQKLNRQLFNLENEMKKLFI